MEFFDQNNPLKILMKMCIPSVITVLIMQIYHMADVFFIGKMGSTAMVSGLSLSSPIIALLSTIGVLFGVGGCAALAIALGKKDERDAEAIVSFSFWTSFVSGAFLTLFLLFFQSAIINFFGVSEAASVYCREYITTIAFGAPFMCFSTAMGSLIRAKGKSYQSLLGNMLGTVLNMALDPLFIFVFHLGVKGAALATVVSNMASTLFYVLYIMGPAFGIKPRIKAYTWRRDVSLTVLSLGLPSSMSTILNFVSSILSNRVLASYGDLLVSSVSISRNIISFVTMLQMGITSGIQPVLAYYYGAKNNDKLKQFLKLSATTTVLIGSTLTLFSYIFGPFLVRSFMKNPEVLEPGVICLRIMLLAGPIAGIQQLSTAFFQATKKPLISIGLSMTRDGLIYLPFVYLLNAFFGFDGYLFARPIATLLSSLLGLLLMIRFFPKNERKK